MRLVLDSAFVIDYLNGVPEARARWTTAFAEGQEPIINEIVVCEVRAGLREHEVLDFEVFLEPIEFIQPGPEHAILAGQWRAEARMVGRSLSLADSLIAAAADAADAGVLTRNVLDFALTPVRVETY